MEFEASRNHYGGLRAIEAPVTHAMKRAFDLLFSSLLAIVFAVPMLGIAIVVKCTSRGPVLHLSERVGLHNIRFYMPKFRTMRADTPAVATRLLAFPHQHLTTIGKILRKTSLDELPQLYSIFRGDMSFVGPRPVLHVEDDLIDLRTARGVHRLLPGLTGWAQINGRDQISTPEKVAFDEHYLHNRSFLFDLKILFITLLRVILADGVSH
jgi:O-antigen biosynthesis protein WbqP